MLFLFFDRSSTIAEILLLFTSAPINCFNKSDAVSTAIWFIFSGDLRFKSWISVSTKLISELISLSKASFFKLISFKILALASLITIFAWFRLLTTISSYSFNFFSLLFLWFSASSILLKIWKRSKKSHFLERFFYLTIS